MQVAQKKPTEAAEMPAVNPATRPVETPKALANSQNPILVSGGAPKARYLGTLVSRNIIISGHRTSVRLEPEMWDGLREICFRERSSLNQVCTSVAQQKPDRSSLTASIRVYVMRYFRNAATEEGHGKAGHSVGPAFGMNMSIASNYGKMTVPLTKTSFA